MLDDLIHCRNIFLQITLHAEFPLTECLNQRLAQDMSCSVVSDEKMIPGPGCLLCPLQPLDILLLPEYSPAPRSFTSTGSVQLKVWKEAHPET